jgi:aminoglycoside phosphotransferase family enzyme/predicted kinase
MHQRGAAGARDETEEVVMRAADVAGLIEALSSPAAYPHPVETVEVRQTHASAVFLAGPFAYKLKKPVRLPFLDFSSPERRRHFCQEEVRLNRRLAPEVYLGVVPVTVGAAGTRFGGEGGPIDWAVKMLRLSDDATLTERLLRGEVGAGEVEALARRVAAFHRAAESGERVAARARSEAVARLVRGVIELGAPLAGSAVDAGVLARLTALTEAALSAHGGLIDARARRGVPRDGHGDLRCDHVYLFPDRPPPGDVAIIDCVEFEERFRFCDPVADAAFLVMDLAAHGRRDLARAFADAWLGESGDEEGRVLLPLYVAYRAMVRGAVVGPLLAEPEVPPEQREAALRRARGRWLLALGALEAPQRRPCLVLTAGLPGSGKSTLARGLAERAGFDVIRSDVVRKELSAAHTPQGDERTYAGCLLRAERALFVGRRVLVDATFRQERQRLAFLDAAALWGVPCAVLSCQVAPETARARLAQRRGASDADAGVHERLAATWEPFGPETSRAVQTLATDGGAEEALALGLAALRRLWLVD